MGKKRLNHAAAGADSGDPLGKLLEQYQVSLAAMLVVSGLIAFLGFIAFFYALLGLPFWIIALVGGSVALLGAVVFLLVNVFNVGRRLELRKRGVRYVEGGIEVELLWDEIADVEVNRTDDTYLGIATVRKRSADATTGSGPLTKTDWDVTIHARDGRSIHLRPAFLRTLANPRKLILHLRLRAGLP